MDGARAATYSARNQPPQGMHMTTTVDKVLSRARSAVGQSTLYWIGAGGLDAGAPRPTTRLPIAQTWATLTADEKRELEPVAIARGIDVHDPDLKLDACDCSGFVCWALGFVRNTDAPPFGAHGGWINTDSIWEDAMGDSVAFQRLGQARPGALVVYPKKGSGENYGHIGIVIEADETGRATLVAHCSAANALGPAGDAIQITAPTPFEHQPLSIYVWCRNVA